MAAGYVLYNKKAGPPGNREEFSRLEETMECPLTFIDITRVTNYRMFFCGLEPEDFVIIAGGDGTLHRFVNDTADIPISCQILHFPCGTGNDFARGMGFKRGCRPFPITRHIKNLPTVTVKGRSRRFLSGVGFGLDGFCCEMEEELRKTAVKPVSSRKIAIQGILFRYVPTGAAITVDGVTRRYKKVWLAPTVYGRFCGGMVPAPGQEWGSGTLSVMACHDVGKLKALQVLPSMFREEGVYCTDGVEVRTGREITVEFEDARTLQMDGELLLSVRTYTAKAPSPAEEQTAGYRKGE